MYDRDDVISWLRLVCNASTHRITMIARQIKWSLFFFPQTLFWIRKTNLRCDYFLTEFASRIFDKEFKHSVSLWVTQILKWINFGFEFCVKRYTVILEFFLFGRWKISDCVQQLSIGNCANNRFDGWLNLHWDKLCKIITSVLRIKKRKKWSRPLE